MILQFAKLGCLIGFYELVTHPTICVARPVPGPSQAKMTADESTHLPCSQLPCAADSSSSSWILTNPEFVDFFRTDCSPSL